MNTAVDEIAAGIYRLSTYVPDVAPPAGFTFNQFLVDAEEPLLFHTGPKGMFPSVSAAIANVMPPERLRWIMFGHVESDECGAMNLFLEAAPHAQVAHNGLGCMVSLNDLCDRPPRPLGDGEVLDLGASRSATSTRRTCRTAGRRTCCSRRPPGPCSAATCSRTSAMVTR
jgi:hypothetical protein